MQTAKPTTADQYFATATADMTGRELCELAYDLPWAELVKAAISTNGVNTAHGLLISCALQNELGRRDFNARMDVVLAGC